MRLDHNLVRDVLASAVFLAFVGGAWWASRRGSNAARHQARVRCFVLGTVVLSLVVGLTERDLFPFTSWGLIAWLYPRSLPLHRMILVDARGGEHDADYRAWQPLSEDELASWVAGDFMQLPAVMRDSAAGDLLRRANHAAQQVMHGEAPGTYGRVLGPLSAPLFHLHPTPWRDAQSLPPLPFRGLRLYVETWDPDDGPRTAANVPRQLIYELRRVP